MRYGAIQLSRVVNCRRDVFGRTFDTAIADLPCTVHTPSIVDGPTGADEAIGAPPGQNWPADVRWWGNAKQRGAPRAMLKSLGIAVGDEASLREITAVTSGAGDWERLLFDWLSVLVGRPLEYISTGSPVASWQDYPVDRFPTWSRRQRPQVLNDPGIAEVDHWSRALRHAGANEEAPPGRVLLVEAFRSLEARRWRPAVFDCATATELAITRGIHDELCQNTDRVEVERILKDTRTLDPLVELARDTGLVLPGQIRRDLIEVRDRAMHQGVRVDESESLAAWFTAHEVVERYEPQAP